MIADHDVPKFIAPRHSGLTLTEAVGLKTRCLASNDLGGGIEAMYVEGDDLAMMEVKRRTTVRNGRWLR
jgi:hypothetical protein